MRYGGFKIPQKHIFADTWHALSSSNTTLKNLCIWVPSVLPAQVNEYGANVTKAHPGKFGFFAALPIPYMNDSVAEIEHALDVLNAFGITVMANLHGKYLGDQLYEPMWAELDRRGAVSRIITPSTVMMSFHSETA